ncbi:CLAVATA3/ESR (CLE)-related protein 25 [Tripterygium wilfordii]|uniref:CLAVATA3/ESR (CLE)-related protein 25 n=1 Tax=Tripterygium wilfordii TaxID=458696 RepID=A0A7J7CZW2_TRIWF|nr:CLAVATA3/ESR (CLE)-related protein 25-like [Tripterygium wilfordii]XP_038716931.1 CLAVATA3/ESR (CLE)-related protein 25-like [Tripterygium wilfordii]XP_038716932.1 CLAVATA3/ESR (CLE)-related protein 25-like [Tripterygium wilfordii]XP_038716933.1 CLAVATA3/ESR (CLE)-related protein 25-like [Tripterygium wilfordii]KAF5739652.1 CLAVATA3/ESR (CLE)-related protein 25 [Tripterygium wilfordii]
MGRGSRVPRALFGAFVFVGVIWLLCVGIMTDNASVAVMTMTPPPPPGDFEHLNLIGRESNPGRRRRHRNVGFHFVSKRRVPNGPDPIHNRYPSLDFFVHPVVILNSDCMLCHVFP